MTEENEKRYYMIYVWGNHEEKLAEAIRRKIQYKKLEHLFGEILIPKEKVQEISKGRRVIKEYKFYPRYMLIEMQLTDESEQLILSIPKVQDFVKGAGGKAHQRPQPVPHTEMQAIFQRIKDSEACISSDENLLVGSLMRIKEGAFEGLEGIVEKLDLRKQRVQLSIMVLGKSTPVSVALTEVEKA